MITFLFIAIVALACVLAICVSRLHQFSDFYDELMNRLVACEARLDADEKTIDQRTESIAKLNEEQVFHTLLIDRLAAMHAPKQNKRYEKLNENREKFKELRETFNHDVKECAQAMRISMKTAKRYEAWRIENCNV